MKRIATRQGQKIFDALLTVTNEFEQIVSFQMTLGTGKDLQRPFWNGIKHNFDVMATLPPKVFYSDQCCHDRLFYEEIFPSLREGVARNQLTRFPMLELPTDPILVDSSLGVETAVEEIEHGLIGMVEKVIGFDCEWTVNLATRSGSPTATIQIALDTMTFVFHLPSCAIRPAQPHQPRILPGPLQLYFNVVISYLLVATLVGILAE